LVLDRDIHRQRTQAVHIVDVFAADDEWTRNGSVGVAGSLGRKLKTTGGRVDVSFDQAGGIVLLVVDRDNGFLAAAQVSQGKHQCDHK